VNIVLGVGTDDIVVFINGESAETLHGTIWDAHDEVLERHGVCPFTKTKECDERCKRPDWELERLAIEDNPFHGLPMGSDE
jgi:hypothetical protein